MNCWKRRSIHVIVSDDLAEFVRQTAQQQGAECPDVIRDALSAYEYLRRVSSADGKGVIQRADGTLERLTNL